MEKCPLTDRDGFHMLWTMPYWTEDGISTVYECPACRIRVTKYPDGSIDYELPDPEPEGLDGPLNEPVTVFNDF